MYKGYQAIQWEIVEHTGILRLNRPERLNAIDNAMRGDIEHVLRTAEADPEVWTIIVTGNGRGFCSGADLKARAEAEKAGAGGTAPQPLFDMKYYYAIGFSQINKPVIAAVNGLACGGGFELALSADLILAADTARFSLPEIRSGTLADAATVKLPKRMPFHIAMDLLFTGRWMEVDEAHRWGLVNEVVPADQLMDRARAMAAILAGGPPLVYAAIKEVVRAAETGGFHDVMKRINTRSFPTIQKLYGSEDQLEGARAFAEKRDPVWKGY